MSAAKNMRNERKRYRYELLRGQLEIERGTYLSHWRDLGQHANPRRMRFTVSDVNRGDRRNNNIIHNASITALRTLRAGMMAGVTSPARPWFRLTTPFPDLNKKADVKVWLDQVTTIMQGIFLKSNFYNALPLVYGDMGQFATAAVGVEEDFDEVVRYYPFPIGTYFIAVNHRGKVDTFCRDFRMTVKQIVDKFGRTRKDMPDYIDWSMLSDTVKNFYERDLKEVWIDVCHVIEPNPDFNPRKHESKFKKFISVYYERGSAGGQIYEYVGADNSEGLLSEKGYDYFPVLCPRWEVAAEDAYGTSCPGMDALGDVRQLQLGEKRSVQAIDKIVNPPMMAPTSMRNAKTSVLPGDVSYIDVRDGQQGFKPVYEVKFSIAEMEEKQRQVVDRVNEAYFKDLFLMFANDDQKQPDTATEVDEKKQEKMLALGPVLEQLNQDLLDPNIDITFQIALRQGKIPPIPKELSGMELKVEYLSIMAQAQKVAGISGIERFANFVGQNSEIFPDMKDKLDSDALVDVYGDMTSVPPQLIRPDEQVAQIRQAKAKQQQQQQQAETMAQQSQSAKNLSQADLSGNNALSALMDQSKAGQAIPQ